MPFPVTHVDLNTPFLLLDDTGTGVLLKAQRRDGMVGIGASGIVFALVASCGFHPDEPAVSKVPHVNGCRAFVVDGVSLRVTGYDEDEGLPQFALTMHPIGYTVRSASGYSRLCYQPDWDSNRPWVGYRNGTAGLHYTTQRAGQHDMGGRWLAHGEAQG